MRIWYDEHGEGEPLALLHPGGADARAWAPNLGALAAHFRVFTPERRGHGRTPDVEGPITYDLMAEDTIAFLVEKPALCNRIITAFLTIDPVPTIAPIRRAVT